MGLFSIGDCHQTRTGRHPHLGEVIAIHSIMITGKRVEMLISKDSRLGEAVEADARTLGWRLATHDENFQLLKSLQEQPQSSHSLKIYSRALVWGKDGSFLYLDARGLPSSLGFYEQRPGRPTFRLFVKDDTRQPCAIG